MKKILTVMLILGMSFSLAACGGSDSGTDESEVVTETEEITGETAEGSETVAEESESSGTPAEEKFEPVVN